MAKVEQAKEFKRVFGNLRKLASPAVVLKEIRGSRQGENLINVVIGQARAGVGPGSRKYKAYSPEYDKRKKEAGQRGAPFWLRGIGNTGREGGMLDPGNFDYEMVGLKLFLVWRPKNDATGNMGTYANVHNEGNDTTPMRKWMHVRAIGQIAAVKNLYVATYRKLAARIAAGGNL